MSCEDLHRTERERDEALAEVERLTVICEEAGMQVGLLEREVERLRRGIEAYRYVHKCCNPAEWSKHHDWPVPCKSCEWEREDEKRKESGDER